MASQQEQAAVQVASDAYVAAQRALLSETDILHQYGLELHHYIWLW